jgi:hypothetical protein
MSHPCDNVAGYFSAEVLSEDSALEHLEVINLVRKRAIPEWGGNGNLYFIRISRIAVEITHLFEGEGDPDAVPMRCFLSLDDFQRVVEAWLRILRKEARSVELEIDCIAPYWPIRPA